MLEESLPGDAAVVGAKHAAVRRADVVKIGIARDPNHCRNAPAGNCRPNLAEADALANLHRQAGAAFVVSLLRASLGGALGCGGSVLRQRRRISGCETEAQQAEGKHARRSIEESHSLSSKTAQREDGGNRTHVAESKIILCLARWWRMIRAKPPLICHPERRAVGRMATDRTQSRDLLFAGSACWMSLDQALSHRVPPPRARCLFRKEGPSTRGPKPGPARSG